MLHVVVDFMTKKLPERHEVDFSQELKFSGLLTSSLAGKIHDLEPGDAAH